MRKTLFLSVAALASTALLVTTFATQAESQVIGPSLCNSIQRELLVSYDTTGGTLTGPLNINLQVYSNGEVKYSRSSGLSPTSIVAHVSIGSDQALKFRKKLATAGAFTLCDQSITVSDVPLSTLTVLAGRPSEMDGRYHTFSYFIGFGGGYSDVAQAINSFIATHIPNQ